MGKIKKTSNIYNFSGAEFNGEGKLEKLHYTIEEGPVKKERNVDFKNNISDAGLIELTQVSINEEGNIIRNSIKVPRIVETQNVNVHLPNNAGGGDYQSPNEQIDNGNTFSEEEISTIRNLAENQFHQKGNIKNANDVEQEKGNDKFDEDQEFSYKYLDEAIVQCCSKTDSAVQTSARKTSGSTRRDGKRYDRGRYPSSIRSKVRSYFTADPYRSKNNSQGILYH